MEGLKFRVSLFLKNKKLLILNFLFLFYMNSLILTIDNVNYNITAYFNFIFKLIGYYLLIALINGFLIGNTEINNKCKDIFQTIEDARNRIIIQKITVGFIISILIWIIELLVLVFIALYHKDNLANISGQFISTLIYILFPIIISTFIGIFIGDNLKKEKAYSLITLIWMFITPVNEVFYNTISYYLNKPTLRWNFTLGSLHMNSFDGILGSNIYDYEISKILIFLMVLIFTYNYYYLNNKKIVYVLCSIIIMPCLYNINDNKYNISDAMMFQRTGSFYSEEAKLNLRNKNIFDNYDIDKYIIDFYPKNKAKFDVKLKIKANEGTNFLSFILYNGFNIISIEDNQNNSIKFERDEDFLNIRLNDYVEKDEEINIKISYEGYSGKEFFINDKGVNLSSRFPYIPTNKISSVMKVSGFSSFYDLSVSSNYEVTIHDNKIFHSNLEKIEKNTFKGQANGLFLLSGDNINFYEKDKVNYYSGILYRSYSDNPKEIENMKNVYQKSLDWINDFIYGREKQKIKNLFILYHNDISTFDIFNDSIISYSEINGNLNELDVVKNFLAGKLTTNSQEDEERYLIITAIFLESIDFFLNNNINFTNKYLGMLSDEMHKESYNNYLDVLKNLKAQEKKEFFREFFKLCLNDVNFNSFNEFIEKYN